MKKICMIMVAFVLTTSLIACKYKEYYGRTPCDQPDTIWISEDGSISIQVNSYQQATGTLWVDNQKITFIFTNAGPKIELYMLEAKDRLGKYPEERYEYWLGKYKRDDQFTAIVMETTFFTEGDRIVFYRVDN